MKKIVLGNSVKSKFAVILNEVRIKNLLQLSTRFFVATLPQTMSGFRRKGSFEPFYDSIILSKTKLTGIVFLILLMLCCNTSEKINKPTDFQALQTNWPIFRGDNNFSGNAQGDIPDSLKLLWKFQAEDEITSSPVVMSGKIYFGSMDGKLYCLDLVTGEKYWEFATTTSFEAPPLILNNIVYIGNVNHVFYAINANNGEVKWQLETGGKIMGSANWSVNPENNDTLIFVGCYDAKMYCIHAETGKKIWTYNTKNFINGAPAIYRDYLIFGGCDAFLHRISTVTGKNRVKINLESYLAASPAVYKNFAYVGDYNWEVVAVNLEDTSIVWKYYDEEEGAPFFSSPAVTEQYVVVGSRDFRLHCIHRKTGIGNWTFRTLDEVESSPIIVNHKVVFCSADGRVYIVNLEDGSLIWSYEIGGSIISTPAVAMGKIIVGAEDGGLYVFGAK